jgi:multicomponent Na+:H+ antiporter subunit F
MTLFSMDLVMYIFVIFTAISMIRVVIGPSIVDRLIGLNMVGAQVLAILVLMAFKEKLPVYLDVALVYDIFGFIGILAVTKLISKKENCG